MTRAGARERLLRSVEWICQTLWLAQRQEPELVRFQQERGTVGFVHYILSRAGNLPDQDWVRVIYVMPPSLVDHLRLRCLAQEPARYQTLALEAGAEALRRLAPRATGSDLGRLASSVRPAGQLPQAWCDLPQFDDPHLELLRAAMTLREGRAHAHYRAAESQGLEPPELLVLSSLWRQGDLPAVLKLFRWRDQEIEDARSRLRSRGWLGERGELTADGRERRDLIEAETQSHTDRILDPLSDRELSQLVDQLPTAGQPPGTLVPQQSPMRV